MMCVQVSVHISYHWANLLWPERQSLFEGGRGRKTMASISSTLQLFKFDVFKPIYIFHHSVCFQFHPLKSRSGNVAMPTLWFWTSGFQNCKRIHFCFLKLPRLRYFVTAALGNEYKGPRSD